MSTLFRASNPALQYRAVHLDLKGSPPTFPRLLSLLELFAALRFNVVLVEWEDAFPWSVDVGFRSETAYSEEEVRQFCEKAASLGLELIPLVQTLGHMENFLHRPEQEALREIVSDHDLLNCLAPGAPEFVQSLIDDVLRLMPDTRRFHLGGDEAWHFGSHPDVAAAIKTRGGTEVFLSHMEPLIDQLTAREIRPLLWHDMLIHFEDAALARVAPKCDLVVWGYGGHPDTVEHHYNSRYTARFAKLGFTLWGATAFKGADGTDRDLPNPEARSHNAVAWMEVAQRHRMTGLITTGWSRYNFNVGQCESIEAALDTLLHQAILFHDGAVAPECAAQLPALLDTVGEGERFRRTQNAMARLALWREVVWGKVRSLRSQLTVTQTDPRRVLNPRRLATMREDLQKLEEAGAAVREALSGLVSQVWIDRYLAERIEPLLREANEIEA